MVANDARWFQNLSDLCDFCNRYKRLPTVKEGAKSSTGTDLYNWLRAQKDAYNKHSLASNRISALEKNLGSLWSGYLMGAPGVVMEEIPDRGTDFSISTAYHRGLIDINIYTRLLRKGVLYLREYLSTGGEVDEQKLYKLLVERGVSLPEWWIFGLYKNIESVVRSRKWSFLEFYVRGSSEELRDIRLYGDAAKSVLGKASRYDRYVVIRRCTGETLESIAKYYGVTKEPIRQRLKKNYRRILYIYNRMLEGDFTDTTSKVSNKDPLSVGIRDLNLSVRAYNCLVRSLPSRGSSTIGEFLNTCDYHISDATELLSILKNRVNRGLGAVTAGEISRTLVDYCNKNNIPYK